MIAWFGQKSIVRQLAQKAKQDMPRYLTIKGSACVHLEKKSINKHEARSTSRK
jgi:hypothetical protein